MRGDGSRIAPMLLAALLALAGVGVAPAYLVGPALSLEDLAAEADLIFKGTTTVSGLVQDEWFKPLPGFVARETRFQVISVFKGDPTASTLRFRHYDENSQPGGWSFEPQYYHFDAGRTYLVFAKRSEVAGVFRQPRANHTARKDQGALLCPDEKPAMAKTLREVFWGELTRMLESPGPSDAKYAIDQLDLMSGGAGRFSGTADFDRTNVLSAIHGLITASDSSIAMAAIATVGSHNPCISDERALYWLATVGSGEIPGIGKMDPKLKNAGGELYWEELVALADSNSAKETRASAIRALGLVREPSLEIPIARWLADPAAPVRASAALLLAGFPGPQAARRLAALAGDAAPEVRACVARASGFGQRLELADTLAELLRDKEPNVRDAAAMSLLSFSPRNKAIAGIFGANLDNEEFQPLFLIALARENPAEHLAALAAAVERKSEPRRFWGGQIPAFSAWGILFRYLQAQPRETLVSGKLDRYLDAMEKVGNYSSSEPRDIYAFYLQRDMAARAARFREAARRAAGYDLNYYFKQVDESPSAFRR